jgi:hypothetical protein
MLVGWRLNQSDRPISGPGRSTCLRSCEQSGHYQKKCYLPWPVGPACYHCCWASMKPCQFPLVKTPCGLGSDVAVPIGACLQAFLSAKAYLLFTAFLRVASAEIINWTSCFLSRYLLFLFFDVDSGGASLLPFLTSAFACSGFDPPFSVPHSPLICRFEIRCYFFMTILDWSYLLWGCNGK